MLQYVNGNQTSGTVKVFNTLEDEDSPAKSLLLRINNALIREVCHWHYWHFFYWGTR